MTTHMFGLKKVCETIKIDHIKYLDWIKKYYKILMHGIGPIQKSWTATNVGIEMCLIHNNCLICGSTMKWIKTGFNLVLVEYLKILWYENLCVKYEAKRYLIMLMKIEKYLIIVCIRLIIKRFWNGNKIAIGMFPAWWELNKEYWY